MPGEQTLFNMVSQKDQLRYNQAMTHLPPQDPFSENNAMNP